MKIKSLLFLILFTSFISSIAQPIIVGTTLFANGPSGGYGSIFTLPAGSSSIAESYFFDNTNGAFPQAGLLVASNGKLYGTTSAGGVTDSGVLYEFDLATKKALKLIDFSNNETGAFPYGNLVEASNGKFYGLTDGGGSANKGVLFEYDPTVNKLVKKVDFNGINGSYPRSTLTHYKGKLYGTTSEGGANDKGVLFEFDPIINEFLKKIDFGGEFIASSLAELSITKDAKIYGISYGLTDYVVFEYDLVNNVLIKRADFNTLSVGKTYPVGKMVQVPNGKMYGVSRQSSNNDGFIFEFNPDSYALEIRHRFFYSMNSLQDKGYDPSAPLLLSKNGKLYGTTRRGGIGSLSGGVLFEYDYTSNIYTKKIDFVNSQNGSGPRNLIELPCLPPTNSGTLAISKQAICEGDAAIISVSISSIAGSASYSWKLPAGSIIKAGENTNSLSIDFSKLQSGIYIIEAAGKNICGLGPFSTISLTVQERASKPVVSVDYSNPESPLLSSSEATSYQWFKNGMPIEGATSKTYNVLSESSYSVVTTNVNECPSVQSNPVVVLVTGLLIKENVPVTFFPNPAAKWLFINHGEYDVSIPISLTIFDRLGKKIAVAKYHQESGFDVGNLLPGLYLIEISQGNMTTIGRFIKE